MSWAIWIIVAYCLGSIPFGLLMGLAKGVDIRTHGSGNIGATNLGRTLGRRWGIACFILDLGKGLIPVLGAGFAHGLIGRWMTDIPAQDSWLWLAVGVAALIGHVFPVYLRFKGGKGVATAFGVLLGTFPTLSVAAGAGMATWLLVVALTRTVSLASMVAACMVPCATAIVLLMIPSPEEEASIAARMSPPMAITLLVALLVLIRHRSNIARLLRGSEHTVGPSET
ncbi:MAG: glycerol-3-phosphate 1-O-acyltransferase PlsY [Phycisphaerales bacterium]|nr:glycerol-3-phosphate 1-O-acyltransferase PlsY [Phycisphaerales bacterium]